MVFVDTKSGEADWVLPDDTHFAQLMVRKEKAKTPRVLDFSPLTLSIFSCVFFFCLSLSLETP